MQLTNSQVMNAVQGLNTLGQTTLPFKLAWKVTTALRSMEPFAKEVEKTMTSIHEKYALRNEDGTIVAGVDSNGNPVSNTVQIPTDKISLANAELNDVLQLVVEIQNVTLRLTDFPDTLEIQPSVLNAILPLFEDAPELKLVP